MFEMKWCGIPLLENVLNFLKGHKIISILLKTQSDKLTKSLEIATN